MNHDTRKMSGLAFSGALCIAIAFDIVGILIPFIGTIFVIIARTSFWISGYNLKNSEISTMVCAALEAFPVVPACTAYVVVARSLNHKNVKEQEAAFLEQRPV